MSAGFHPQRVEANAGGEHRADVFDTIGDVAAMAATWREWLSGDAESSTLFQDPDVVLHELERRPEAYAPLVIVVYGQRGLECLAPLFVHKTSFGLRFSVFRLCSLRVRLLRLFGSSVIFRKGADRAACLGKVFEALYEHRQQFDLLHLECVELSGALWGFLNDGDARFGLTMASPKVEKVHSIVLPATHEEWLTTIRGRKRRKMHHQMRKFLETADQPVCMTRVTEPEQVPWFLEHLDTLHPRTWQAEVYGARPRNTPSERAHFQRLAENGWLRSYVVCSAGRPVTFLVGHQYNGLYAYQETGYAPELSALSPGIAMDLMLLEDLYAHDPPSRVTFGFGDAEYKRTFSNHSEDAVACYVSWDRRWRAVTRAQHLLNRAYTFGHDWLVEHRLDKAVRRLIKFR